MGNEERERTIQEGERILIEYDDNWSEMTYTEITTYKELPPPTPADDDVYKNKPNKKICKVCGKKRIQVRCEIHTKAKGCTYCHLVKEHL